MVPTNLVHIVVGPGTGTWDRENKQTNGKYRNSASQQVLGRTCVCLDLIGKIYRLKGGGTDCEYKSIIIK